MSVLGVHIRLSLARVLYRLGTWIAGGPSRPERRRPRLEISLSPEEYRDRIRGRDPDRDRARPPAVAAKLPPADYDLVARFRHRRMPGRGPRSDLAIWIRPDPDPTPDQDQDPAEKGHPKHP